MVSSRFRMPFSSSKRHLETFPPKETTLNRRRAFAQKVIGRHARFGKQIVFHQVANVPATAREKQMLTKMQGEISEAMQKRKAATSTKLVRLLSVQKILQESLKIRLSQGGRNPTAYQIAGKFALIFGLNSQELRQAVTTMATLNNHYPELVTWGGRASSVYGAIRKVIGSERKNLPSATEEFLHGQRKPLTSKEIASGLAMDFQKIRNDLNAALQLLETSMYVKKLPLLVEVGGERPVSVWVHRAYKPQIELYKFSTGVAPNPETHFKNSQMEILNQLLLHNGSCLLTQLYKEYGGKKQGNPDAIYTHPSVAMSARLLEQSGLIKKSQIPIKASRKQRGLVGGAIKGTGTAMLELTGLGKKLWQDALKTGVLSEELRVLLLGEKEVQ